MKNIGIVVHEMKGQLDEPRNTINGLQNELRNAQGELMKSNNTLLTLQAGQSAAFVKEVVKKVPI